MAVCTRGNRRGEFANHWEMDGDCRRTRNGVSWLRSTVASARIQMTEAKRRTRRSWRGAARASMPCSAVGATMVASMHDWMRTDSTGRHQRVIRPLDGSTTLVGAGKRSIVKAVARSNEPFRSVRAARKSDSTRNEGSILVGMPRTFTRNTLERCELQLMMPVLRECCQ